MIFPPDYSKITSCPLGEDFRTDSSLSLTSQIFLINRLLYFYLEKRTKEKFCFYSLLHLKN